ncbi:hypothetical protein BH23GEM9_BH23GEM9_25720 [soil metagenome]
MRCDPVKGPLPVFTALSGSMAVLVATLLAAMPVAAQEPTPVTLGTTASGTLGPSDPSMNGAGPFRVFRFEVREEQRLVATLRSDAFDALLTIMRPLAGIHETIASDDDGGGGTDSRIRWLAKPGTYHIVAQALASGNTGGFSLLIETASPPRPAPARPIRIGESASGILTDASPMQVDDNRDVLYDLYVFDAKAGQQLILAMQSDEFDTFLAFGRMLGDSLDVSMTDDDGGSGTDSAMRIAIPADGRYGIQARSYSAEETGRYTLSLREARIAEPRAIRAGVNIAATLGDEDPDLDNSFFHTWAYEGRAGETVVIRLSSDEFDTTLRLDRNTATGTVTLAENDDENDETTNSLISFSLPASGTYLIRAGAFGAGEQGRYTLRVEATR